MGQEEKVPKDAEKLIRMIGKLEPQEFIGVCKILGVKIYDLKEDKKQTEREEKDKSNVEVRPAEKLVQEVIDKILSLNRIQRRNLKKLIKLATKGRKNGVKTCI